MERVGSVAVDSGEDADMVAGDDWGAGLATFSAAAACGAAG